MASAIVLKICGVTRARTLEHTLEIGEIVARGAYGGSLSSIREQGERHPLYQQIAVHPDLPFTAKRLWICVKVYELLFIHPKFRESTLGIAHLRAVLNLTSEIQERFLTSAVEMRWTCEQLEKQASAFRRQGKCAVPRRT